MGTLHKQKWISNGVGQSRKQRRSGAYYYYLPTPLSAIRINLSMDVSADVSRAERSIIQLNDTAKALHNSEGLARLLLRAEAVSSSFIEGLTIGARRLLRAEVNIADRNTVKFDESAAEIIGNVHAMEHAIDAAVKEKEITVQTLLAIHQELCKNTRIESFGGVLRETQNWVGGNSYNPLDAEYIPPAPELVLPLLEDLAVFCNSDLVSPVVQAAIAHAQFESIHPFMDGNGRTGRALVHLILRRRGIALNLVPPISLIMATHSESYVQELSAFRFDEESQNIEQIQEGINDWISFFAGACTIACEEALEFERSAAKLQKTWRKKLGAVRKNSALDLLLDELVGMPVFTIKSAGETIGRSVNAVAPAIERCVDAGIVKAIDGKKRNKVYEVPDVISEFNLLERKLASPLGNTEQAKPVRLVPVRMR